VPAGARQIEEALDSFERALRLAREAGLQKEEADWLKGRRRPSFFWVATTRR